MSAEQKISEALHALQDIQKPWKDKLALLQNANKKRVIALESLLDNVGKVYRTSVGVVAQIDRAYDHWMLR